MNTSSSTRFSLIARSMLGAVAFVSLVGVAQSQATPAASTAAPAETSTSKGAPKAYDPDSPFVWDVLGATPSIRLPWKSAKPSASAGAQKVEKADKADKTEKSAPSAAGPVEPRNQAMQVAR